ncbi:MAG: hypothetical protein AABY83_00870 [Pseudomonadota bacterium]
MMTQQELNTAKDKDLIASVAAMKRAAALARKQAIQTDTAIVVVKEKKIVRLTAEDIRKEGTE